ncbi:TPM domain-containing protein [Bordetella tumbae]|uniref:TPM domain-containing protein n=1 Tax=Bordetella tumbae TaxID=1649139 RepID=UPI0039EDEA6D
MMRALVTTLPEYAMPRQFLLLVSTLIGLLLSINTYAQYSVESLPNPKDRGDSHYVSDPDGNLQGSTVAELDAISATIEQTNGSEFAIAVVNDYQGGSDFQFALDLFNHWGIGKQGANNGLLLFLAMDRHEYRFISGYGVEGIFPDALLKQIGERYLVPYLQSGNTDMAVLSAAKAIESVFLSPEHALELEGLKAYEPTFWNRHSEALDKSGFVIVLFAVAMLWMSLARKRVLKRFAIKSTKYEGHPFWLGLFTYVFLLFMSLFVFLLTETIEQVYQFKNLPYFVATFCALILSFHYHACSTLLERSTKDKKTALDMRTSFTRWSLLPLVLAPFAYLAYAGVVKNGRLARLRATPPDNSGDWSRQSRDKLTPKDLMRYLTSEQQCEEKIESKSYEIWINQKTGANQLSGFAGKQAKSFSICPQCHAQTLKKPAIKVIEPSTYSEEGKGERIQTCAYCDYKKSLGFIALAVLSDSDSSSSGGSSSGGGGSSSSSSGSFGGGSSGGGGAGGRW